MLTQTTTQATENRTAVLHAVETISKQVGIRTVQVAMVKETAALADPDFDAALAAFVASGHLVLSYLPTHRYSRQLAGVTYNLITINY